jgi:tRNA pseudouridine55 synthase
LILVAEQLILGEPQGETQVDLPAAQEGQRRKRIKRPLHGVFLLDKPIGWSSNDAMQKVRWLFGAEKAGHTGTLDPLATGVLPICFGAATKFSQVHLEADKGYEATALLGVKTSTGDAEGEVIERRAVSVDAQQLLAAEQRFTGVTQQVPPMYSALKKDGRALYEYARQGLEVEREARSIAVHTLSIEDLGESRSELGETTRKIRIRVRCSKGTYIRTLAEDIGEFLGCGASLTALRRTHTGSFDETQCVSLEDLMALAGGERSSQLELSQCLNLLRPVEELLSEYTSVVLEPEEAGKFLAGMRRRGHWSNCERVAVYASEPRALLGTARVVAGELISQRLLNANEIKTILDQTLEKTT